MPFSSLDYAVVNDRSVLDIRKAPYEKLRMNHLGVAEATEMLEDAGRCFD